MIRFSNATEISAKLAQRCAASLYKQRATIWSTRRSMCRSGRRCDGNSGCSVKCFVNTPTAEFAVNNCCPVSRLNIMAPNEYTSARASTSSPRICSGDIKYGVPTIVERSVVSSNAGVVGCCSLAKPKSSTLAKSRPPVVRVTKTFSGFKSRWMIPNSCASLNAPHTCTNSGATRPICIGPSRSTMNAKSSPRTYSMIK